MPASKIGTIDPMDTKTRAYVTEDLKEVAPGSPDAAFVYARFDLDRVRAQREELGIGGDEAARASQESAKASLVAAERRAAEAEAEVASLQAVVKAGDKAAKSTSKGDDTADDAADTTAKSGKA